MCLEVNKSISIHSFWIILFLSSEMASLSGFWWFHIALTSDLEPAEHERVVWLLQHTIKNWKEGKQHSMNLCFEVGLGDIMISGCWPSIELWKNHIMNLQFKYKQSSEFKGSTKDSVKPYCLSCSVTAVWTTTFLTKKKKKQNEQTWRKSSRIGKLETVGRKTDTEGSLTSGLRVVALLNDPCPQPQILVEDAKTRGVTRSVRLELYEHDLAEIGWFRK